MNLKRFTILKEIIENNLLKIDLEKGHVYRKVYWRTKKVGSENSRGYRTIGITYSGKLYSFSEHEIIAVAMGLDLIGKDVNHKNKIRSDNRACNLEAITHAENMRDRYKNNNPKLSNEDLNLLVQKRDKGTTWKNLCKEFKISEPTLRKYYKRLQLGGMNMHEGYSMENCEWCGKRFMSDCGDAFCSSSCERAYKNEHAECQHCREEVGGDNLDSRGLCDNCAEELDDEE